MCPYHQQGALENNVMHKENPEINKYSPSFPDVQCTVALHLHHLPPPRHRLLVNRASSSAYCLLPADLPPFATAVKTSVKEKLTEKGACSWACSQDKTSERIPRTRLWIFLRGLPTLPVLLSSLLFTAPGFHHPTWKMVSGKAPNFSLPSADW